MPIPSTAIADIEAAVKVTEDADDPQITASLLRLSSDLKSRLHSGTTVSSSESQAITESLGRLTGPGNSELRIGCLIDLSYNLYVMGSPFQAIEPAKQASALAARVGMKALERRAVTTLGIMYADTGNIPQSIECLAHALEIVQPLGDKDGECVVWNNIGVALLYAAQYRDAIDCFERVISIAGENPTFRALRLSALSNIALASLHLEDYARGLRAAETAIKESQEPKSAKEMLSRVLLENNYARLLLEVNSIERANERCAIAKQFAAKCHSARAEIAASVAEGLCEVHAGKADLGISRLTATLEKARILRPMLRDTLAALVKSFEFLGQPQRALVYLREMMEATRQVQQDNALRHLKLHLDQIGVAMEETKTGSVVLQRREAALRGLVAEQELFRSRVEMLERLAVTAELRDDSTGEHSYRVGKLSSLLAIEYGCDDGTAFMIELAARLHDIGKIGVPDAILLKPDKLNDAERQVMRTHTTVGAELLSKSNIPHMQMAEEIARFHHEWWDGSGYPGNLSGTAIPLASRITALADVFDALTHKRPYKEAWPIDRAIEEIARLKGQQFDPQLTDYFLVLVEKLRSEHSDIDSFLGQAALSSPFLQARSKIWDTLRHSKDSDGSGANSRLDLQR
ncbi:MAG: HD domain-containing protein [Burkholderiales bacterium]|nr:HD domain-containing protein [Burkholderiales bacterium]